MGDPGMGNSFSSVSMGDRDFQRLSEFIQSQYGIMIPPAKKFLLETRLRRRLAALDLSSFSQYCEYLFHPRNGEEEMILMIDAVSTNKTDFFREPSHFEYLADRVLPDFLARQKGTPDPFRLWSAGCSTGEEPYTLALVLNEFKERCGRAGFEYSVLATDISTKVLSLARWGGYPEERVEPIPLSLRKKYLLRSRDREKGLIRINAALSGKVEFRRLNLMEMDFQLSVSLEVIFCRNVMIYFSRETQVELARRFWKALKSGGYLFLGHAESLSGLETAFEPAAPTVYRKSP